MSRRIDIELTSSRDDGSWTWRAAGAREPRGTLDGTLVPSGAQVGDVLRAEIDGYLDRTSVVAILPPRAARREPERLELLGGGGGDAPLVTTALVRERPGERRPSGRRGERRPRDDRERDRDRDRDRGRNARGERDRSDQRGGPDRRDRDRARTRSDRDDGRAGRGRQGARHERAAAPAPPPVETKPKPKRLRPGKTHRTALLEAVAPEQRPIAEQLLQGGIPAVRLAIDKQNESLRAEGKTEVKADQLLRVAEDLRHQAAAAVWRDRAEAAIASVDDLDLRDLRSVVNAAGDAGRDEEARKLAAQLREALTNRVEKEHAAWLAELADTLRAGRVVRALRLSSRPPKAGAPVPGDLATQLVEAASSALTAETGQDRWATVLDALAFSPIRRRVVPQSLPTKLSPELRATVARFGTRLPEIAHIFAIEPDESSARPPRGAARRTRKPRPERAGRPAAAPDTGKADAAKADSKAETDAAKAEAAPTDGAPTDGAPTDTGKATKAENDTAKADGAPTDTGKATKAETDTAKAEVVQADAHTNANQASPDTEEAGTTTADPAQAAADGEPATEAVPVDAAPTDGEAATDTTKVPETEADIVEADAAPGDTATDTVEADSKAETDADTGEATPGDARTEPAPAETGEAGS
jgi:hypothetical protein